MEQNFPGTNITSGGSIFQGAIKTQGGAVNISGESSNQRQLAILAWLTTTQYHRHHKFARTQRLEGTGLWLFQRSEYQRWASAASSSAFWLYGIPGAGKTELASSVIDKLAQDHHAPQAVLLYFYCGSDENGRRSSAHILRTLIHEILCIHPGLFEAIEKIYERNRLSGFTYGELDLTDSKELLTSMILNFKRVSIVIDALDECDAANRSDILDVIDNLLCLPESTVKVFVSSRYSDDIAVALDDHIKFSIRTQDNRDDIEKFVKSKIDSAIKQKKLLRGKVNPRLQQNLKSKLARDSNGMFLWARLQISHLCDAVEENDLLCALDEITLSLEDTYTAIWKKVQQQRFSRKLIAEQTLEILLNCFQPLSATAVAQAVSPRSGPYGHNEIVDVALILDVCQNLVVLDPELGVLRVIHFTAHTYLKNIIAGYDSHSRIVMNAIRHLSNPHTLRKASNLDIHVGENDIVDDFTIYAILKWPTHVLRSDQNCTVETLVQEFMMDEPLQRLWITCLSNLTRSRPGHTSLLLGLLRAYSIYPEASWITACFFGLRIVELPIKPKPLNLEYNGPIKPEFFSWRPAEPSIETLALLLSDWRVAGLLCASGQGHSDIVNQLLQCFSMITIEPVKWTRYGDDSATMSTVIECCRRLAIAHGHIRVVEALHKFVKQQPNLGQQRLNSIPFIHVNGGRLALAAHQGQKKMMDFLHFTIGIAIDTPLKVSAGWQNERAFIMLLDYATAQDNLTDALFEAVSADNGKIVEIILMHPDLLERNIAQQQQIPYVERYAVKGLSQTPLIAAAWGDCAIAAKALCQDKRIPVNTPDSNNMNALQIAVLNGHTDFLQAILQRDDLFVNERCGHWNETPLITATRKGHTKVVRLLLEDGRTDPTYRDAGGLTALDIAIMKDHEPLIKLLSQNRTTDGETHRQDDEDEDEDSLADCKRIGRWFA